MTDRKINCERCQRQEQAYKTRIAKRTRLTVIHNKMKTNSTWDCKSEYWIDGFSDLGLAKKFGWIIVLM